MDIWEEQLEKLNKTVHEQTKINRTEQAIEIITEIYSEIIMIPFYVGAAIALPFVLIIRAIRE